MTILKESGKSGLPTPNSTASFWHSQPSERLTGHRTTIHVPPKADVVIIGSGISGAFAAYWLKQSAPETNVVMLEAREACWGATGRNGGHCQPNVYMNTPEMGSFELRNLETLKKLIEDNDIQCDWRSLPGVHGYLSKSMFNFAVESFETLKKLDPILAEQVGVVTPSSTNPSLADLRVSNSVGAITQKNAASLWPYKLVSWVLESLLDTEGFNLQTNTPVTHLQSHLSSWIVHTSRGQITAPKVVLCTNAYTSHLLPKLSEFIVPVRGEMSSLVPPPGAISAPLQTSFGFMGHLQQNLDQDDYLVQRPVQDGGELMFGGARSYAKGAGVGVSDDSSIDEPAAAYLRREILHVLDITSESEGIKELKASYEWSGIMGYSRDGHPWVGPVPEAIAGGQGLYVCAGFTGHGMPNTSLCAKAAIDSMLGKEADLPGAFWITEHRLESAGALMTVKEADEAQMKSELLNKTSVNKGYSHQ